MSWEARKYHGYARECVRLAQQAESLEKRNKLLELARVWVDAAVMEEQMAFKSEDTGLALDVLGTNALPLARLPIRL